VAHGYAKAGGTGRDAGADLRGAGHLQYQSAASARSSHLQSGTGRGAGYILDLLNASGAIGVEGSCKGTRRGTFVAGIGMPTAPVLVNIPGKDPIIIGGVNKATGADSALTGAQQPTLPIAKTRHRKYRYEQIDQ
jgi:hypothetical protein